MTNEELQDNRRYWEEFRYEYSTDVVEMSLQMCDEIEKLQRENEFLKGSFDAGINIMVENNQLRETLKQIREIIDYEGKSEEWMLPAIWTLLHRKEASANG